MIIQWIWVSIIRATRFTNSSCTSRAYSRVDYEPRTLEGRQDTKVPKTGAVNTRYLFAKLLCQSLLYASPAHHNLMMPADVRKMNPSALFLADTLAGADEDHDASGRW
jgi:hypothetical protein